MSNPLEKSMGGEPRQEILPRSLSLTETINALEQFGAGLAKPSDITTAESLRVLGYVVDEGLPGYYMLEEIEQMRDFGFLEDPQSDLAVELRPILAEAREKVLAAYRADATVAVIQVNALLKSHPRLVKLRIKGLDLDLDILELMQSGLSEMTIDKPKEPSYFFMTAAGDYGVMDERISLVIDPTRFDDDHRRAIEAYKAQRAAESELSAIINT